MDIMDARLFHATSQLESQLSGIYQVISKKEKLVAEKIKHHSEIKISHAKEALFWHLVLNASFIAGLYYLLY